MNLWQKASALGSLTTYNKQQIRYLLLSNKVSILLACFTFLLSLSSYGFFGFITTTKLGLAFSVCSLLPLLLNYWGHPNTSRILLAIIISVSCLAVSLADKMDYYLMEEMQFYEFRLLLLSATLLPFILFSLHETKLWVSALLVNLLCIVAYDPVHEFFHVGYYNMGFTGPNYYFINFMMLASFSVIASSTYFLKYSFEKFENENRQLIEELSKKQKALVHATNTIEDQRKRLEVENERLNSDLLVKNNQLTDTNNQLIIHNNNLEQFSYTISHNLRGPLASLQGLANLLNPEQLGEDNKSLFDHFIKSVNALDTTIRDLNHIIEIRNDVLNVRDKINLNAEIEHIKELLKREIEQNNVIISCEFKQEEFVTVKALLHSVLYNLISNAIKYRSYERSLIINLRSKIVGSFLQLEVQDNGLGIDMAAYKDKIFGLYKRFHTHTEGKGLGLFLVKLQTETLGGTVQLQSKPGVGSTFIINIKIQE